MGRRRARSALQVMLAAALSLCAAGCSVRPADPADPADNAGEQGKPANLNVLLVTLDTVRADHLGCYGDAAAETPALDRLAAQGVRFARASTPVPLTLPAHASLLSGLLPPHHGVRNNGAAALPAGTATLATRFAGSGYRTAAFVSAFVLDHRFGLQPGFEVYDDEVARDPRAGWVLEATRPADQVVDRALAWLARADARPFFLWVHLYDAHAPYSSPAELRRRHAGRPYDAAIAFDDQQAGRLLAEIDRRGWGGQTVVAVAADHGESLGEHGEATHGLLLYEPALAVPLLLRAPGLPIRVVATPISLVDLAPTLAGLAGHPLAAMGAPDTRALDGRDLAGMLRAGQEPPRSDLYAETRYPEVFGWSPLAALRRRDLKYISAPRPELYDLASDPHEHANLAAPAAVRQERMANAAAARPSQAGAATDAAGTTRGFARAIAEIEAGAVAARPAAIADAETRSRLASLGYVAAPPAAPPRLPGAAAGTPLAAAGRSDAPDPKDTVGLFQRFERAHAQEAAGHANAAAAELAALVAADPHNPIFRGTLAQNLRRRGRLGEAIRLYEQAAAAAPADPDAWYNLAATLQEAGRLPRARAAVERALRLDPERPEAHNTLGIVYLAEKRPELARQEFARAVAADPRNAHAWNNLGNVLRGLGRPAEAEQAYRRALAAAPRYAEPLNGLGTLEVERDKPAAALSYFDRALALAPDYQEVHLNRGIALELAGDATAASAAYREFLAATDREPRFAEQRRAARQLLAHLGTRAPAEAPPAKRPEGGR
ncbi:MAG TPA: sulfatase-like hydrolase/transferase [Thermoanaerobaculia bacterium]|nr:sulfatase-like hydrolase/transferase [Thermoanaerobaculia bacterium]